MTHLFITNYTFNEISLQRHFGVIDNENDYIPKPLNSIKFIKHYIHVSIHKKGVYKAAMSLFMCGSENKSSEAIKHNKNVNTDSIKMAYKLHGSQIHRQWAI